MGADVIQLHPEALEILREVAARPDSVLLRVPRGAEVRALREDEPLASASDSRLSRAERHLVQVHREELAFALRQAAWYGLATSELGRVLVYRRVTPDFVVEVPSAMLVGRSATDALRGAGPEHGPEHLRGLLEACVPSRVADRPEPFALCAAAHRLSPTGRGRVLAGSAFVLSARPAAASECFRAVLARPGPEAQTAIAWSNYSQVLDEGGRPDLALHASRRASLLLPGYLGAACAMLWYASECGDQASALEAVREIDQTVAGRSELLDEPVARFMHARRIGSRPVGQTSGSVFARLSNCAGPAARRILDVVAQTP